MVITKQEAIARLTRRWQEQQNQPLPMRNETKLEMYIAMNWQRVAANGMLVAYASDPPL